MVLNADFNDISVVLVNLLCRGRGDGNDLHVSDKCYDIVVADYDSMGIYEEHYKLITLTTPNYFMTVTCEFYYQKV